MDADAPSAAAEFARRRRLLDSKKHPGTRRGGDLDARDDRDALDAAARVEEERRRGDRDALDAETARVEEERRRGDRDALDAETARVEEERRRGDRDARDAEAARVEEERRGGDPTATPSTPSTPKPQEWKKHEGGVSSAKAAPIPGTTSAAPTSGSASSAVSGGASSEVGLEELPATGPSTLWNGMIHPLLNMRFAGIAWYQGEANFADPPSYACHFPAFVKDARLKFGNPGMSFAFVQLAGYQLHDWSEIRNAQMTALKLPGVTFATALDLGDPSSPWDPVHSRRKQEVGRRLAMAAIFLRYGSWGGLHHHGPTFAPQRPIPVAFGEAGAGVPGGVRLATVDGNAAARAPGRCTRRGRRGASSRARGSAAGRARSKSRRTRFRSGTGWRTASSPRGAPTAKARWCCSRAGSG